MRYCNRIRVEKEDALKIAGQIGIADVEPVLQYWAEKGIILYYSKVESLQNDIFTSPSR